MHELSIAQDILTMIQQEALVHHAVQVKAVRLRMGTQSHLDRRSLQFCLESIIQDTLLDAMEIHITPCEADVECPRCGRFPLNSPIQEPIRCPKCGEDAPKMPPTEIYIQEIVLDVDDHSIGEESTG